MRIRGLGRLQQAARRFGNIFMQKGLILAYHRVSDLATDPQLLSVTPQHFREHLEILQKSYQPLSLQQLALCLKERKLPDRSVVVTFDDGYADNLHNAKPLLEQYAIPAMVSVTTGYVGQAKEFWWDELERLLLLSPSLPELLQVSVNGVAYSWHMDEKVVSDYKRWNVTMPETPTPRHRAYRDLHRLLRPLGYDAQEAILADLRRQTGDSGQGRSDYLVLSPEEVHQLAAGGLVEIGSHTVTHPVLADQSLEFQRFELVESKRQLEAILEQPVTSLAYSYGTSNDAGEATAKLAREAGYKIGLANFPFPVTQQTNIFQLPRYLVRDWGGDTFASHLARWFRG